MDKILFYDTCSLLNLQESAFNTDDLFYISSITLNELESIKTSGTKDEETKFKARTLYRLLQTREGDYGVIVVTKDIEDIVKEFNLPDTADSKIIACAIKVFDITKIPVTFVTDDVLCRLLAKSVGLSTQFSTIEDDNYTGFKEIEVSEKQLADFYEKSLPSNINTFNLLENEYLILKLNSSPIETIYKWKDEQYIEVSFQKLQSTQFGKVTPYQGDIYQKMAIDSLVSNKITMLRGRAGTGKSYLAFAHLFSLLEKGTIGKIIVFCNTVATKGSAKLGFYPGSRTEKLLDSQIGNLLISKIGDREGVERLISQDQLILLPMSDIRGFDTTGMNAGIYISEAQNLDRELMRLALQRIGEDSICIIDGDFTHQVDMAGYAGANNGMRKTSKVFRGHDVYGEVELQNIYRSKIAAIAEDI